jgi:hypothetical protein
VLTRDERRLIFYERECDLLLFRNRNGVNGVKKDMQNENRAGIYGRVFVINKSMEEFNVGCALMRTGNPGRHEWRPYKSRALFDKYA